MTRKEIRKRTNELYLSLETTDDKTSVYWEIMLLNQYIVDYVLASVKKTLRDAQRCYIDIEDLRSAMNLHFLLMLQKYDVHRYENGSLEAFCRDGLYYFAMRYIYEESMHGLYVPSCYRQQMKSLKKLYRLHGLDDDVSVAFLSEVSGLSVKTLSTIFTLGEYTVKNFAPDDRIFDAPVIEHKFDPESFRLSDLSNICTDRFDRMILAEFESQDCTDADSVIRAVSKQSGISRSVASQAMARFLSKCRLYLSSDGRENQKLQTIDAGDAPDLMMALAQLA